MDGWPPMFWSRLGAGLLWIVVGLMWRRRGERWRKWVPLWIGGGVFWLLLAMMGLRS